MPKAESHSLTGDPVWSFGRDAVFPAAQSCSLLDRRILFCKASNSPRDRKARTTLPIENQRYSRLGNLRRLRSSFFDIATDFGFRISNFNPWWS